MTTETRKQRELHEREELILDTAQTMLYQHGYGYLTMDRVAESVEYSKGTIYNHFASKEDLVFSLSCRCVKSLIRVFEQAYEYHGSTRDRFSAIGVGYSLFYQLNPMGIQNIQTVRNYAIREKVAQEKLAQMETMEMKMAAIAQNIVQEAIDAGDLDRKHQANINTIVFGFWSMHYGALLLEKSDMPLHQLGFNPVVLMLWQNANTFLDGYQWKPLSITESSNDLFMRISSALFGEQLQNLKNKMM
jgi:AcrR family transcriptional regulator